MRPVITCEPCGARFGLERDLSGPADFPVVCPVCEQTLRVVVTAADISRAVAATWELGRRARTGAP